MARRYHVARRGNPRWWSRTGGSKHSGFQKLDLDDLAPPRRVEVHAFHRGQGRGMQQSLRRLTGLLDVYWFNTPAA